MSGTQQEGPVTGGNPGVDRDGVVDPISMIHATPGSAGGNPGVDRDGVVDPISMIHATPGSAGGNTGRRKKRRGGGRSGDFTMVPDAEFTSYYGRAIVKESPWEADIPAYLFAGGLAAGSSIIAVGADLTDRPVLRRVGRLTSLAGLSTSGAFLVHDLGRPERFLHMLRVMKPTSPMSVGTWILTSYAPFAGLAAVSEIASMVPPRHRRGPLRLLGLIDPFRPLARPAGIGAAAIAPLLASYTAVLLADTATPSWHEGFREMPFVFVGSALAASAGMGLVAAPLAETSPVRRLAVGAVVLELTAEQLMERTMGITAEPLHDGLGGRWMKAAKALTLAGGLGALLSGRSRAVAAGAGVALMAGSVCTRFGIFEAGQASARDPKYTVVPQRARIDAQGDKRSTSHTSPAAG